MSQKNIVGMSHFLMRATLKYLSSNRRPTIKHPLKVMVWGCFNYYGIGRLEICDRYVNRQYYKELLQNKLLPSIEKFEIADPYHLDDSAPPHRGKDITEWHQNN